MPAPCQIHANMAVPYQTGIDWATQVKQQSAIKKYSRCFYRAVLALLLMGMSVTIIGHLSADTDMLTASHQRMLTLLKQITNQTTKTNDYIGEGRAHQLRRHRANLPVDAPDLTRWRFHTELSEAELRLGNEDTAIDQLTQAGKLLPHLKGQLSPLMANQTLFRLGVAYMCQGETQNCCPDQIGIPSNPDSCILPMRDGGIHTQQEGSLKAITYLTEVLRNTTVELPLHLEARLLLNIAYMTIGGYPEQVPKPYFLSGGTFGANPLQQTVGLAKAEKIEMLEIFWQTTGLIQTFHDVPFDQFIQITKGKPQYTSIKLEKLQLGLGTQIAVNRSQISRNHHKTHSKEDSQSAAGDSEFSDFAAYYNRGLDLSKSENYLGAVESLKKAVQIAPNREEAPRLLGRIYLLYLAKTTEAIKSLQAALKLNPNIPITHQLLGVAHFRRNQYPEAIQALQQAIELNPEVTPDYPYHPYYDLGMVYLKQGELDDAIICFEKALEIDPDQIRAYYSLGNAYIRQGTVQKGAELIRKYQNLKPYMNLVSQLEIALQQNPDNPERRHQLGRVHAQYGRFEKAITSLEQSIKLSPNNWEVYNVLAVCHMRLNQLDKMQRVCEKAVGIAPDEPNTHNTLGMSLFLQRRYSDATQSFTTAIRLDPHNPEFHENLGETYKRLGEPKKAAQEFRIAQQLRSK